MCTEFHMNTWKYVWAILIKFSDGVPCATPGSQPLRCPNGRRFQCVCTFSRVFDHVKPTQKCSDSQKNKRILTKSIGPCAILAWALISITGFISILITVSLKKRVGLSCQAYAGSDYRAISSFCITWRNYFFKVYSNWKIIYNFNNISQYYCNLIK